MNIVAELHHVSTTGCPGFLSQKETLDLNDGMQSLKEEEELGDKEEKKVYTEADFEDMKNRHMEELQCLRIEYELQLHELIRVSTQDSPDGLTRTSTEPTFISACTSPIPQRALTSGISSSGKNTPRPRTAEPRTSSKRAKKIKTGQALPEWGKNLPENFLDRLEQFSKASAKYHQDLNEKTKKSVQENYELQMATQNRLRVQEDELDINDVCLPALFMPSRMGTVYSPKAALYFHPSGVTGGRFTQAPSVFKLPSAVERSSSSIVNLFEISQNFMTNGPAWLSKDTHPRSACVTRPGKDKNESLFDDLKRRVTGLKVKSE